MTDAARVLAGAVVAWAACLAAPEAEAVALVTSLAEHLEVAVAAAVAAVEWAASKRAVE